MILIRLLAVKVYFGLVMNIIDTMNTFIDDPFLRL